MELEKHVKFSFFNSKILHLASRIGLQKSEVACFDLPAGWSCPAANICETRVSPITGKMEKLGRIVCYAARAECAPSVRRLRWHNYDTLNGMGLEEMIGTILESLPAKIKIIRLHSSGDFFNGNYFNAWRSVAVRMPNVIFFGFTKVLPYAKSETVENLHLIYSYGSVWDNVYDTMPVKPPTCFIAEHENQYTGIPVVCGSVEKSLIEYLYP